MDTTPENIDDLIAGYLLGESTPQEATVVEQWRAKSSENQRHFDQLKLILEKSTAVSGGAHFDTDMAWRKVRSKLSLQEKTLSIHPADRWANNTWLKIAAGIIVLLTVGIFAYNASRTNGAKPVEFVSDKKTESDTLPDGSDVFLNRMTNIAYTVDAARNVHTAKLAGEAYFNIHHDDAKTFIVEAQGTFIKDIGTSFNVKAYPDSDTIEVVVEEGAVMFYSEDNPGIYLKANGRGIYDKRKKTFTIAEPEPNLTAYKTKFFSFTNHSLATVVKTLNSVYASKIIIDEKLTACRLTVSFNDENIEEIAGVIAQTLGLTVEKSGSTIKLQGSGCGEGEPQ